MYSLLTNGITMIKTTVYLMLATPQTQLQLPKLCLKMKTSPSNFLSGFENHQNLSWAPNTPYTTLLVHFISLSIC